MRPGFGRGLVRFCLLRSILPDLEHRRLRRLALGGRRSLDADGELQLALERGQAVDGLGGEASRVV